MNNQNQHCSIDPLRGLKTVSLDFEKKQFSVNGVDIGHCTDVEISFHDGIWTVNLGEQANFTTKGDYIPKKLPATSGAAGKEGN